MPKLNGTHVVIIVVAMLAAVTILSAIDRETGAILMIASAILAALGWVGSKAQEAKAEAEVVRHQTNGAQTARDALLAQLVDRLALSAPVPVEPASVALEAVSDPVSGDGQTPG